jgi:hypothetical protein
VVVVELAVVVVFVVVAVDAVDEDKCKVVLGVKTVRQINYGQWL